MTGRLETLDAVEAAIWEQLALCVVDKSHPWRTPVLATVDGAGWFQPTMPRSGRPMSVRMCNLGPLGWLTDRQGYRYQATHPDTGLPWPPLPPALLELWDELTGWPAPPQACLVNLYRGDAKMGLHQDRDEQALTAPVLSVSLGDDEIGRAHV